MVLSALLVPEQYPIARNAPMMVAHALNVGLGFTLMVVRVLLVRRL